MTEEEFRMFDELHGIVGFLDEIKLENKENANEGNDSVATASTSTSTRGKRRGSATPRGSSAKKTP
jgi:hypothetical protein